MDNTSNIAGNNVLIVGGAKGIGKETCKLLLSDRFRLIVADKDELGLADLKSELKGDFKTLLLDITDHNSVSSALKWIEDHVIKLDIVVISAAVHSTYPAEFVPDDHLEKVINVNLITHIKLVRDVLPLVNDGGRIIGISSNCADIGIPMESAYASSKAGLERFYEALSIEISYRKIRPIIIQPGNVNTGFNETGNDYLPRGNTFIDEGYQRVVAAIDSRKGIDPSIVAKVIVRAIKSPNPRFRYIVGMNAMKAHWAKRLLGTDLALKLLAKYFGFNMTTTSSGNH